MGLRDWTRERLGRAKGAKQIKKDEWGKVKTAQQRKRKRLLAQERYAEAKGVKRYIGKINDTITRIKAAIGRINSEIQRRRGKSGMRGVSAWGGPSRSSLARQPYLREVFIHHTVYPALSPNASVSEEAARMRQIHQGHLGQNYSYLGYSAVVFPSGRAYQGRGAAYIPAATKNNNTGSYAIAFDGNFETSHPTASALETARKIRTELGLQNSPRRGHREVYPTACPGDNLQNQINRI